MTTKTIMIGCRGENGARAVTIDISEIVTPYPTAAVTLLLERPTEDIAYPATTYSVSGNVLTWLPTDIDTGIAGIMRIQIVGTVENITVKTMVMMGVILPALGPDSTEYPEPIKTWMEALQRMLVHAAKLENVGASVSSLAPGSDATVTITQTATSTTFAFGIPLASMPDFRIDEHGHLIAIYQGYETDVGPISAYAEAVAAGYTGTQADFEEDVGNSAANAAAAAEAAASVSPSTQDDLEYILGGVKA